MFGRRKSIVEAAPSRTLDASRPAGEPATVPLPALTDEQAFALVHERLSAALGERGRWTVRLRTENDTDDLFQAVFTRQLAAEVTTALYDAQAALSGPIEVEASEAVVASDPIEVEELEAAVASEDAETGETAPTADVSSDVSEREDVEADDVSGPSHRHDEPERDDGAELDEDSLALQWEPAPITVWTDLKRPVTGEIALELLHAAGR